ncbi:SDR family oxidoreductase [Ferrovibrio sp.]|uniref:SDR family oxidoreductase n=1 Tax=Ferrovibrio sp. TaxID=1917215 RepID=UPI0026248D62|nr:SDR family oxidoreductase [Ferrovibrio sp.]
MPTLLITGANRGIGLEFVKRYAAEGWQVIACCRDPQAATALQAVPGKVTIERLEVTDYAAVDTLAAGYADTAIDLLLNNAGIYGNRDGALSISDFDTYLKVLQVNSVAPMKMALALLPALKKARAAKIATISSRMGSIGAGAGGSYVYRASKAAINAAMHNLALDLKPAGITCIVLHPGWVKTDMGGQGADITVETSVSGLKQVIDGAALKDTGKFFNYDGSEIPW